MTYGSKVKVNIIKIFLTAHNVNFSFILVGGCLFWHTLIYYGVQIKADISAPVGLGVVNH